MASILAPNPNPLQFFPPKRPRSLRPLFASPADKLLAGDDSGPPPDAARLALAKAGAYRKSRSATPAPASSGDSAGSVGSNDEAPDPVKLALERAREYKMNRGIKPESSGQMKKSGTDSVKISDKKESLPSKRESKEGARISSVDFLGLDFSEKKSYRGAPPGLVPITGSIFDGEVPEVEIIVGDASKFEVSTPQQKSSTVDADNSDVYKPKVSTWGVFPRPSNISKTFGGGRNIKPGESLETADDKAAKEKNTRELIAAYKRKMGLTIDAKTKDECEKAMKEGDRLMDCGQLQEALSYYEKVMKSVVFQSELHGLAALQWSICQDSLRRSSEARAMYEKLQSHSNVQVSKKAKQFVFSFQAMEMMKVTNSSFPMTTGYEDYFDAFVENKARYSSTDEDPGESTGLEQVLPYVMFLVSPIFFVLLAAVRKSL